MLQHEIAILVNAVKICARSTLFVKFSMGACLWTPIPIHSLFPISSSLFCKLYLQKATNTDEKVKSIVAFTLPSLFLKKKDTSYGGSEKKKIKQWRNKKRKWRVKRTNLILISTTRPCQEDYVEIKHVCDLQPKLVHGISTILLYPF